METGPENADRTDRAAILFLHGDPTSSYLWRNIIPLVADTHRVLAPDLIGMGDSGKPAIGYTYAEHKAHLDALLAQLDLDEVVLVVHDWGSVPGLHWARDNADRVKAVALMEAGLPSGLPAPSFEAMGEQNAELFRFLCSPEGQSAILRDNFFVEEIFGRAAVATPLTDEVMEAYRAPLRPPKAGCRPRSGRCRSRPEVSPWTRPG